MIMDNSALVRDFQDPKCSNVEVVESAFSVHHGSFHILCCGWMEILIPGLCFVELHLPIALEIERNYLILWWLNICSGTRKAPSQGADFPRELNGDRNRLPSEPARLFIRSPERHSQLQVVVPVVRIVRPFN